MQKQIAFFFMPKSKEYRKWKKNNWEVQVKLSSQSFNIDKDISCDDNLWFSLKKENSMRRVIIFSCQGNQVLFGSW